VSRHRSASYSHGDITERSPIGRMVPPEREHPPPVQVADTIVRHTRALKLNIPSDLVRWSGRRDSNPRPPPWQGGGIRPSRSGGSADVRFRPPSSQRVQPVSPCSRALYYEGEIPPPARWSRAHADALRQSPSDHHRSHSRRSSCLVDRPDTGETRIGVLPACRTPETGPSERAQREG
jgi:hypothetical protein